MGVQDPVNTSGSARGVFLDRDGVLNRPVVRDGHPFPPSSVEETVLLDGVDGALRELKHAGFRLVVVTNQPDVARGKQTRERVEAIHQWIRAQLPVDAIHVCYHDDADDCCCRKPRPGLLFEAARALDIDLATSFLVGDRWRDISAGRRAGVRTIFVDHGYDEALRDVPDLRVRSLAEAVPWILSRDPAHVADGARP